MKGHSRLLFRAGLFIGVAASVIGIFIPGGGLRWFLHTGTGLIGPTLGLALIASGAVVQRLERDEEATRALRESSDETLPT